MHTGARTVDRAAVDPDGRAGGRGLQPRARITRCLLTGELCSRARFIPSASLVNQCAIHSQRCNDFDPCLFHSQCTKSSLACPVPGTTRTLPCAQVWRKACETRQVACGRGVWCPAAGASGQAAVICTCLNNISSSSIGACLACAIQNRKSQSAQYAQNSK